MSSSLSLIRSQVRSATDFSTASGVRPTLVIGAPSRNPHIEADVSGSNGCLEGAHIVAVARWPPRPRDRLGAHDDVTDHVVRIRRAGLVETQRAPHLPPSFAPPGPLRRGTMVVGFDDGEATEDG